MIYSRSAEYAIRASLHLGLLEAGKCAMAKEIAQAENIPVHFLAKLLQQLARKGVLKSQKGPTGGFCLKIDAKNVRLIDIVDAVDGLEQYSKCVAGLPECGDHVDCPLHTGWVSLHTRIMSYLTRNTIGNLVKRKDLRQPETNGFHRSSESKRARRPSV